MLNIGYCCYLSVCLFSLKTHDRLRLTSGFKSRVIHCIPGRRGFTSVFLDVPAMGQGPWKYTNKGLELTGEAGLEQGYYWFSFLEEFSKIWKVRIPAPLHTYTTTPAVLNCWPVGCFAVLLTVCFLSEISHSIGHILAVEINPGNCSNFHKLTFSEE